MFGGALFKQEQSVGEFAESIEHSTPQHSGRHLWLAGLRKLQRKRDVNRFQIGNRVDSVSRNFGRCRCDWLIVDDLIR